MKASKKKKSKDRPIFEAIRKPTAPPTRKFENDPEVKRRPSLRKSKHKKAPEVEE